MGRALRYGYVAALLATAWTMGLELAHVLKLPATSGYEPAMFGWLQQTLYFWSGVVSGTVCVVAVVLTALVALATRHDDILRWFTTGAFLAEGLATIIFFAVIYPVNLRFPLGEDGQPPADWATLRLLWEAGHVAGFVLFTLAFLLLTIGLVRAAATTRA
ncbi:hypothetical protein J4H86_21865 [Spiractinospora alimapuensis]|uniref:hypothetical protein n=1 Tax=Spiractinospora alimapuensis TaxID=2820884 RepID=UPI001F3CA13C|nr:hypothetical protein [Spiractinospora alimapuensis]QVQ51420.1 hypothetical protein J4H86_21865 [Spiractinospora alimapuensis]